MIQYGISHTAMADVAPQLTRGHAIALLRVLDEGGSLVCRQRCLRRGVKTGPSWGWTAWTPVLDAVDADPGLPGGVDLNGAQPADASQGWVG